MEILPHGTLMKLKVSDLREYHILSILTSSPLKTDGKIAAQLVLNIPQDL